MAETYNIYFGTVSGSLSLAASGVTDLFYPMPIEIVLDYKTTYYWRIDADVNGAITTGDEWYFATIVFAPPISSYELIPGGNGNGPPGTSDPSGVEGTDWNWTGLNFTAKVRRLVAAAANAIWYESV